MEDLRDIQSERLLTVDEALRAWLPMPLPPPIACERCGYDADQEGFCSFCGHLTP